MPLHTGATPFPPAPIAPCLLPLFVLRPLACPFAPSLPPLRPLPPSLFRLPSCPRQSQRCPFPAQNVDLPVHTVISGHISPRSGADSGLFRPKMTIRPGTPSFCGRKTHRLDPSAAPFARNQRSARAHRHFGAPRTLPPARTPSRSPSRNTSQSRCGFPSNASSPPSRNKWDWKLLFPVPLSGLSSSDAPPFFSLTLRPPHSALDRRARRGCSLQHVERGDYVRTD